MVKEREEGELHKQFVKHGDNCRERKEREKKKRLVRGMTRRKHDRAYHVAEGVAKKGLHKRFIP